MSKTSVKSILPHQLVKITDKCKKVTQEFIRMIDEIENDIFSDFTDEEKENLKITLRDLSKKYYELNHHELL